MLARNVRESHFLGANRLPQNSTLEWDCLLGEGHIKYTFWMFLATSGALFYSIHDKMVRIGATYGATYSRAYLIHESDFFGAFYLMCLFIVISFKGYCKVNNLNPKIRSHIATAFWLTCTGLLQLFAVGVVQDKFMLLSSVMILPVSLYLWAYAVYRAANPEPDRPNQDSIGVGSEK